MSLTIPLASTEASIEIGSPPVAPRIGHREVRHGELVADDYFWLREKSNPEVIKYLEAENAYTAELTKGIQPFVDKLYREMLGRIKQTDLSVPVRRGKYFYYSRTVEGKQYPIQCRRKGAMDGPEEVLLDENELAMGHGFVALGAFEVSDDQNLLAYTIDFSGFRQYRLQVKDLQTGSVLPDTAERVTSIEWAADNKTLFFTTEEAVTKRSDKLFRQVLGSASADLLYHEQDECYDIELGKSRDRKFLFLNIESKDTTEYRYLPAETPQAGFRVLLPRRAKHRYYVDHREGDFYIRTNKNNRDFEVVTAPVSNPVESNWRSFIPPRDGTRLEELELFRTFAVSVEKSEALHHLRVYNFQASSWSSIPFPEPIYFASSGNTPDFESTKFRYSYQSFITPSSIYDYDTQTGSSELLKREEVLGGYDPSQYVSERLWATSRDGARVPVSVVYKRGFERNGKRPLFLYAYGSYGYGISVTFSSNRLSLLDRGMAYAIAHVRGGDEMGENGAKMAC